MSLDGTPGIRAGLDIDLTQQPGWLFAGLRGTQMLVYQSVLLKEDSRIFADVAKLLPQYDLVEQETVEDENMMFGSAIRSRYILKEV